MEILRFLCSLSVLLWHYTIFMFLGAQGPDIHPAQLPFYTVLSPFYERGDFAVPYFWCISGFIFFWKYQIKLRDGMGGREFLVLRLSRLYPLHFATLLYVAIVQFGYFSMSREYFTYIENTPLNFVLHLFMLGNLQHPYHTSFNGVTWSVSVEMFAYISFFVVCRFFSSSSAIGTAAALLCCAGFVFFIHENKFLQCFGFFYLGGCVCFVHRWIAKHRIEAISAVVLFGYYAVLYVVRPFWPGDGYVRMVICIPAVVLAFACLPFPRFLPSRLVSFAGELTYSAYMLHFPIILTSVTVAMTLGKQFDCRSPILLIAYLAGVFFISSICYVRFERPAQAWLRRAILSSSRIAAAANNS